MFQTLHTMFMTQCNKAWMAVDMVAERIQCIGLSGPSSYKEFAALTSIKDSSGSVSAKEMIRQLVIGQETVVRTAREVFLSPNQPTVDLLSARMVP